MIVGICQALLFRSLSWIPFDLLNTFFGFALIAPQLRNFAH